jgi:hypothetical protein
MRAWPGRRGQRHRHRQPRETEARIYTTATTATHQRTRANSGERHGRVCTRAASHRDRRLTRREGGRRRASYGRGVWDADVGASKLHVYSMAAIPASLPENQRALGSMWASSEV